MTERVLADTTTFAYLTKAHQHSSGYQSIIGTKRIVISFQSRPELIAADYQGMRGRNLERLMDAVVRAPHSEATDTWYVRVAIKRKELKRNQQAGGDAGDADVWIIASALEHGIPLVSHDASQVALAREMLCPTYTEIPALRGGNP